MRKNMSEKEEELVRLINQIKPLDPSYVEASKKRWNSIAKPLHSLGKLEDAVMKIAGMTRSLSVRINKRALLVMCADNGVVAEGVTQTGQEVTAIVAENFLKGTTSAAIMCTSVGVDLFPVDVGMVVDTKVPQKKVARGTANFLKEAAMTREEAIETILTGIYLVKEKVDQGYNIIATGEMGIGNTTSSSGVASVLLDLPVEDMTGRGAGLDDAGLVRKIDVIRQAISLHQPDRKDPVDLVSKIGGFDLAALTGIFLGGALYQVPVILDGFISGVAALLAYGLCEHTKDYMLASHVSKEPASHHVLEALGLSPVIHGDLCLGEGTGAVAFLPLLDMAVKVYEEMSTFSDINVEDYEDYEHASSSHRR